MKKYIICKNCREDFAFHSDSHSRHDLEDEVGRFFFAKCNKCQSEKEYHVNEVKADESRIGKLTLLVISLVTIGLVFFAVLSFGLIGIVIILVPAFAFTKYKSGLKKSVELFNQSNISRTRTK